MRAITVVDNRPKVLRIAVVVSGRIVEERILGDARITVGSREDATILIKDASLPTTELFARSSKGWQVQLGAGMSGRVANASGVADLFAGTALLGEDARGKVVIGQTTLLFQLVAPAPIASKPQLPLAVKGGLANQIDWSLTIVAALSFLMHFGIVGAMYSDWMDPIVSTDHEVAGLVDLVNRLPDVPIEQQDVQKPLPGTVTPTPKVKAPPSTTPGVHTPSNPTRSTDNVKPGTISDQRAAELAERANAMNIGILVAENDGPSVKGALRRSEIPPVDLSDAARSSAAAVHENGDIHTSDGTPVGKKSKDLSTLVPGTTANATSTAGTETNKPPPPIANATIEHPTSTGPINDADIVVAGLRGRFRKCYQNGLDDDPTMKGRAVIVATVGPNGEVLSSTVGENAGLSPKVTSCVAGHVQRATFKGNGSVTTIRIPVSFFHQ